MKQVINLKSVSMWLKMHSAKKNVQNIVFVINLCVTDICTILAHVIFLRANVKSCLFSPLVSRQITEKRHMGWQIVPKQRIHSLSESFWVINIGDPATTFSLSWHRLSGPRHLVTSSPSHKDTEDSQWANLYDKKINQATNVHLWILKQKILIKILLCWSYHELTKYIEYIF